MSQEEQNTEDIAENTQAIAENTQAIETNLATLNAGGEDRWRHIHASERAIAQNSEDILVLNLVRLRRVQLRINVLAGFVLAALLLFSIVLQHQAANTQTELGHLCDQVQVNARVAHLPPADCH